jgi:hypothetical protein
MVTGARMAIAIVLGLLLSACSVRMYGNQSASGGATATTTSSQISGAASFSHGRAAFSYGQVPPPGAPGGHLRLTGDAVTSLIIGVVIVDLLNYIHGEVGPKPLPPDTRIADTCSCYQKPVSGEP